MLCPFELAGYFIVLVHLSIAMRVREEALRFRGSES